ncbi:hypothetical protein GCM10011506_27570 [Marivirga lumbricoides]|uniref:DUF4112 domain-containing protein n=1 Tax=Marivirga lumbricoides TaxID=1046115 RepID=A0A2T4DVW7_9BACT|nr:DUF4112 domain-containing protein [Marivirga lumbricoides]GGC40475.1 hypothetical protein GCM10011506_27570 [Marivirga lumbricoides]
MPHSSKPDLKWIRRISQLLDSKFRIPSTSIRFGLDPIFSIIPGLGDLGTYVVSLMIVYTVRKNGASGELVMKMLINASLDALIGSIPILGTIFDVWYKSNEKNLRLVQEYYEEGKHQGSGKGLLFLVILIVISIIAALIYIAWWAIVELGELIS